MGDLERVRDVRARPGLSCELARAGMLEGMAVLLWPRLRRRSLGAGGACCGVVSVLESRLSLRAVGVVRDTTRRLRALHDVPAYQSWLVSILYSVPVVLF